MIDIFVKKEYRGKSIAKKLIEKYVAICKKKGVKEIQCLVQKPNKIMQEFMKKVNWKKGYLFYLYGKTLK